jgi:hypothetical protein
MKQKSLFFASRSAPLQGNVAALRCFSAQSCPLTVREIHDSKPAAGIRRCRYG